LNNACEALNCSNDFITISVKKQNSNVTFTIEDSGCGISEENISKIIEPFFTTKRDQQCEGLGLSASYGIVDLHGGNIEFESEEGEGTTVTVTFPFWSDSLVEELYA